MRANALRHAMYYGLFLGLIFCLHFFLSTQKGLVFSILQTLITFCIPVVTYYFTADCKKRICENEMSYGTALWYGIQLFFYAAIISTAFKYVYFAYLKPEFLPNLIDESAALMEKIGSTKLAATPEELKELLTPINFSLNYLWIDLILGFFVSLVMAFFVRGKRS